MSDFLILSPLFLLFFGLPIAVTIFNFVRLLKRFEEKKAIFPTADIFSTAAAFIYLLIFIALLNVDSVLFTLPAAAAAVLYLIAFFFNTNHKPLLTIGCVLMVISAALLLLNQSSVFSYDKFLYSLVTPCPA